MKPWKSLMESPVDHSKYNVEVQNGSATYTAKGGRRSEFGRGPNSGDPSPGVNHIDQIVNNSHVSHGSKEHDKAKADYNALLEVIPKEHHSKLNFLLSDIHDMGMDDGHVNH